MVRPDTVVMGDNQNPERKECLTPDTVVRWQRERFCRYWTHLSKRSGKPGRPAVSFEIRKLIRSMALANGLWRAPRDATDEQDQSRIRTFGRGAKVAQCPFLRPLYGTNSWLPCVTNCYYVLAIAEVHVPT